MIFTKQWHDCVGSTNVLCREQALLGADEGLVILAKSQTDGRGRLGRSFFSPEGSGLYMSLLLRPAMKAELCTRLTALAAVAVCRAVRRLCSLFAQIKWVNDVYLDEKKLCGILTQAVAQASDRPDFMIVGIGVNLISPQGGFPKDLSHPATALYSTHPQPETLREAMANGILEEFSLLYPTEAWPAAIEEYRRLCFLPGRRVRVLTGSDSYTATVLQVNEDLSLQVRTQDHRELSLHTGEVSLKLQ